MTGPLQRKSLRVEFKAAEDGTFRATLATFKAVDHDGDVTFPGAFPIGKKVLISAYQHGSWAGALPVGKGVVGADESKGWIDGEFFLDTINGLDTYRTVKNLDDLQEWSYGYDPVETSDKADLEAYPGATRGLVKMDIFEASPVLLGAGVGTGTDFIKSMASPYGDHAEAVLATVKAWVDRSRELAALRAKEGRVLSSANRDRLGALLEAMGAATADIQELLAAAEPADAGKAGDQELLNIWLAFQRNQAGLIHQGV